MALIRIADPHELRPAHVVLLAVALVALAGGALLMSAEKSQALPDGAVAWRPDSPMLAIVELLNLRNTQPTYRGVAIKNLVHGLASGVGVIVAVLGLVALGRSAAPGAETVIDIEKIAAQQRSDLKKHIDPTRAAQGLMLGYLGWAGASALWSHAPGFAIRGAALVAIQAAWAFALGFGLNRRAAKAAGQIMLAVLGVTAALAIAYHRERNPTLRASYPIGNPLLLAAVLIPALVIAVVVGVGGIHDIRRGRAGRGALVALLAVGAALLAAYAFHLASSRGPAVGLAAAALATIFFAGGKRLKIAAIIVAALGMTAVGVKYYAAREANSPTGRSTTIRVRLQSWDCGLQLFTAHPFRGTGQGGFALTADSLVTPAEVLADPDALEYRVSNAHCEWLEVAAELGSVGFVLVGGAIGLTLLGAARAVGRIAVPQQRWMLIALTAALVGLCAAESFSVGLRLEGFPLVFYSVLGLVWALSRPIAAEDVAVFGRRRALGIAAVLASFPLGILIAESARADYASARAEFDASGAFREADYARAALLAENGYRARFAPQRRAAALHDLAAMHARIAEALYQQYQGRVAAAREKGSVDAAFAAHLAESRGQLLGELAAGQDAIAQFQAADLSSYDAGWVAYSLNLLRADMAALENDAGTFAASRAAAASALERELLRRPFEPQLAASFANLAAEALGPAGVLEVLSRPLRLRRAPPAYLEFLDAWGKSQPFAEGIVPALDALSRRPAAELAGSADEPWAAEKLRVGAITAFLHGDYDRAVGYLEQAVSLYRLLRPAAPLAYASALAELADARFRGAPEQAEAAIAVAEQAVKDAPASELGRNLIDALAQRLIIYRLAAGQEDKARALIARLSNATGPDLDALLADRYVNLAYSVFNPLADAHPDTLIAWADRAVRLAPDASSSWFLAADLAILNGDLLDALRCVQQVIRCQGAPENVAALLQRALTRWPDSAELHELATQYRPEDMNEESGSSLLP